MISLDTETTGLDFRHGCKAFLVTICDEEGNQDCWEWVVNPVTRMPRIRAKDLREIQDVIDDAQEIVLQNSVFDVEALQSIYKGKLRWDWSKVRDTLLAGHLLASNQRHDLATMALIYLRERIQGYEDQVKEATKEARRIARSKYPEWMIAKKDLPIMPSIRGEAWKVDMWLLQAIAREENYDPTHPWWVLCSEYANADSGITLPLYLRQREIIEERQLTRIYEERLKILPIVFRMQANGITVNKERHREITERYSQESVESGNTCVRIAKKRGYELVLPKSGNNNSLLDFAESPKGLGLKEEYEGKRKGKESYFGKSARISLGKGFVADYIERLEELHGKRDNRPKFLRALVEKRKRDTAVNYLMGYTRFWLPTGMENWHRLHPRFNPTGSDTLRWSSNNPNAQNISKKEGFNLRYCFGPAPGREWWSLDANNIELRIPAYESGEKEQIALFEEPDKPPFFGSNHLLVFSILHPDKWRKYGADCKKKYASTWYQWTKNGNFAIQYGAVESSGTADRAYHVEGAQKLIQSRFRRVKRLNDDLIAFAEKHGYVETIPDKTVDPKRGYPLLCQRTRWGKITPTIPLNYHVQGSAMWWMMKAMIRCQAYLDRLNERVGKLDYLMVMQVHDELVFDFPRGKKSNLTKIRKLRILMEQGGDDIGIPTPVSCEYHDKTWSEGESL